LKATIRAGLALVHKDPLDIDDALPLDEWIEGALTQFAARCC
jgi:hypothetical protein